MQGSSRWFPALKEVNNLVKDADRGREYFTQREHIGPEHLMGALPCLDVRAKLLLALYPFIHSFIQGIVTVSLSDTKNFASL